MTSRIVWALTKTAWATAAGGFAGAYYLAHTPVIFR